MNSSDNLVLYLLIGLQFAQLGVLWNLRDRISRIEGILEGMKGLSDRVSRIDGIMNGGKRIYATDSMMKELQDKIGEKE